MPRSPRSHGPDARAGADPPASRPNRPNRKICSKPVVDCIDYIYEHLHTRITVKDLADHVNLNPSYLSRLFKKETGTAIGEYIQIKKIETAQNMLVYSDYTLSQIAKGKN